MASYQNRVRLIGELMSHAESGSSLSDLTRRVGSSHYRVSAILGTLVCQGLLVQDGNRYYLSARGKDFLEEYRSFQKYSESVGMTV